eukprot:scaffold267588_cov40-Tisochrysis_lutea.AAC.1
MKRLPPRKVLRMPRGKGLLAISSSFVSSMVHNTSRARAASAQNIYCVYAVRRDSLLARGIWIRARLAQGGRLRLDLASRQGVHAALGVAHRRRRTHTQGHVPSNT